MNSIFSAFKLAQRQCRNSLQTSKRFYREIVKEESEKKITIKALRFDEDKSQYLKPENPKECPIESRGLHVTYQDVLILRQFITEDGDMLSRDETGLSQRQYYKISSCVAMAQRAKLLPGKEGPRKDMKGNVIPHFNCHLSRYDIGERTPFKGRGPWYRKRWHRIGNEIVDNDFPQVSNKRVRLHH